MKTYLVLLRGINVGGKNKLPMVALKACLEEQGFTNVTSYIQSGNILLQSDLDAKTVAASIEAILPQKFLLDSSVVKVLVLTQDQLAAILTAKPKGFGEQPDKYHSDVIFLIGTEAAQVMHIFQPREGVDMVWPGAGVVYSQCLSVERTKSRLNKIIGTPEYQLMTIRNWNTTTKLLQLVRDRETTSI